MTPSLGSSGRVQPPEAARRRTDRPPDPEATSRLPQNFHVEGERNHGSDGDEAQTPPADRSQQGPRDVDRTLLDYFQCSFYCNENKPHMRLPVDSS